MLCYAYLHLLMLMILDKDSILEHQKRYILDTGYIVLIDEQTSSLECKTIKPA